MASFIVLLLVLPGLWLFRQWVAQQAARLPQTAPHAHRAGNLTALGIFVLIFGYAGNVAPDAWDLPLGIVSLAFVFLGVLWAYRRYETWRGTRNVR